jgi:hypothetical protein
VADFISEDMRLDWEANRDMLLAWWASGKREGHFPPPVTPPWLNAHGDPDTLPWAARQFERCSLMPREPKCWSFWWWVRQSPGQSSVHP